MSAGYEVVPSNLKDAPWMTMVHGMSQDRRVFSSQVDAFRSRFRILLIDLPGHGLSSDRPGPYGHHEFSVAVAGAMAAAGVDRSHFWGTHTGATVGLLLAARNAAGLASLILEGPVMPGETPPSVQAAISGAREAVRDAGLPAAKEWWFTRSQWFEVMRANPAECRASEHRSIVDAFEGAPWRSSDAPASVEPVDMALETLRIPVLVYNGELDHADFLATSERLAALVPNCRRELIPSAGAFAAWEYPARVNAMVMAFLDARGAMRP
jgi:3-oxoadipate enol-lactonase